MKKKNDCVELFSKTLLCTTKFQLLFLFFQTIYLKIKLNNFVKIT